MFKRNLALIILIFISLEVHAIHIQSISPVDDIDWVFESTLGFQNISQMLIAHESGSNTQSNQALTFTGLMFQSFFKKKLMSKANLNLGFVKMPRFLWTDNPDFEHDSLLNESLKCVEFDAQFYLPIVSTYSISIFPFLGYSFVNYSYNPSYLETYVDNFSYYSLSAGIQYFRRVNRIFTHTYYFSYSPMLLMQGLTIENAIHYFNYGAQVEVNTHPIGIMLFITYRKAIKQSEIFEIFDATKYSFNTTEYGFAARINLR